jgi:hypothetical protein
MRLLLERVSTRRTANDYEYAIFDEVSGKCVGTVNIEREHRRRAEVPREGYSAVRLQVHQQLQHARAAEPFRNL